MNCEIDIENNKNNETNENCENHKNENIESENEMNKNEINEEIDNIMFINEDYEKFYNYITESIVDKQEKEYISNIKLNYNPNNIEKYKLSELFKIENNIKYLPIANNEKPFYSLIDIIGNEYVEVERVENYYYENVYLIDYKCRNEIIKHYPGKISITTNCNAFTKIKDFDDNINLPFINKQLKKYFQEKFNTNTEITKKISWSLNDIEIYIYTDFDSEYLFNLYDFEAEFPYINKKYFEKFNLYEYFEIVEGPIIDNYFQLNDNNNNKYIINGKYPVIGNSKFNNGIVGYVNDYNYCVKNEELYTLSNNGYLFKQNQNFNVENDVIVLRKIKDFNDDINLPAITYQLNLIKSNLKEIEIIDEVENIEVYIYTYVDY